MASLTTNELVEYCALNRCRPVDHPYIEYIQSMKSTIRQQRSSMIQMRLDIESKDKRIKELTRHIVMMKMGMFDENTCL